MVKEPVNIFNDELIDKILYQYFGEKKHGCIIEYVAKNILDVVKDEYNMPESVWQNFKDMKIKSVLDKYNIEKQLSETHQNSREKAWWSKRHTYQNIAFPKGSELDGDNLEYMWLHLYEYKESEKYFSEIINNTKYKSLSNEETLLYQKNKDELLPYFTNENVKNIIIYGPGDGIHDISILKWISPDLSILHNKNIIPVDINISFLDQTDQLLREEARKNNINISISPVKDNYISPERLNQLALTWNMYLCWWGHICQLNDETLQRLFDSIKNNAKGHKAFMIVSFFIPPSKDPKIYKARAEYKRSEQYKILSDKERALIDELPLSYELAIEQLKSHYGDPNINNPYYDKGCSNATENRIMKGFEYILDDTWEEIEGHYEYRRVNGEWKFFLDDVEIFEDPPMKKVEKITPKALQFHVDYQQDDEMGDGRILSGAKIREWWAKIIKDQIGWYEEDWTMVYAIQWRRFLPESFKKRVERAGWKVELSKQWNWYGFMMIRFN